MWWSWTFVYKHVAPIALRYEIVSSCIKFTWNLPAAFPQEEASELYILFGVENNEMYRFTVAPVTQPNHLIIGLHLYKTYGVDVELGTKRPNKRESFNVLLPLASYQMAMKASGKSFHLANRVLLRRQVAIALILHAYLYLFIDRSHTGGMSLGKTGFAP